MAKEIKPTRLMSKWSGKFLGIYISTVHPTSRQINCGIRPADSAKTTTGWKRSTE
jgi:hypothetical protein